MNSTQYDTRTIVQLARDFLSTPSVTFTDVGDCYQLSNRMVANILYHGIAENILSTNTAEAVYSKIIKKYHRGHNLTPSRWDEAFEKRAEKRSAISKKIRDLMSLEKVLEYSINNYDVYVAKVNEPLTEDQLVEKLTAVKERIEKLSIALS